MVSWTWKIHPTLTVHLNKCGFELELHSSTAPPWTLESWWIIDMTAPVYISNNLGTLFLGQLKKGQ